MLIGDARVSDGVSGAGRFAMWCGGVLAVAAITLLTGVGVAAVLGDRFGGEQWSRLSDVGQTFGVLSSIISGLALVALVITARIQFREIRHNRADLERQREFWARSQQELHRTAESNHLGLLMEILKMSIDDDDLAAVWPEYEPVPSRQRNRQYLYANIIYQFNWSSLRMNGYSDEQVLANMRYLFTSQLMREYWAAGARARKSLVPGSSEFDFARRIDELCGEYDVVATASHVSQPPLQREPRASTPTTASSFADEFAVGEAVA